MALDLVEIAPAEAPGDVHALIARATAVVRDGGSTLVESVWAAGQARLYLIVDGGARDPSVARDALVARLRAAELPVKEVAAVRLVGTPAAEATGKPSYLVEWDLPAELGMERYLKRKAEKTPLYAQVPEVQFLRTYVREDTVKCLCLYDAPDEDAVRRARAAVSAPISRLAQVESLASDAVSTKSSAPAVTHDEGT
jgi:hypothetical protein